MKHLIAADSRLRRCYGRHDLASSFASIQLDQFKRFKNRGTLLGCTDTIPQPAGGEFLMATWKRSLSHVRERNLPYKRTYLVSCSWNRGIVWRPAGYANPCVFAC